MESTARYRESSGPAPKCRIGSRHAAALFVAVLTCFAGCSYSPSFTIDFPDDADLGELWLVEDVNCFTCGNGNEYLGRATGSYEIRLPARHWYVSLQMPAEASDLVPHLGRSSLSNIGDIDLHGSDIVDNDLQYLAGVNLRSIDLRDTGIRGDGLRYLLPHQKWTWVDLRGCDNLDPKFLRHFRGWRRSTIHLTSGKARDGTYSAEDTVLLERAREAICDGLSEQECGTQLR